MTTVVIVEDHEATLYGLEGAISRESDMEVVGTASDAISGLDTAREKKPDIILLDLHLPNQEGPRSTVRKFLEMNQSKVIVFSAEKRRAFVQAILELGVNGSLLKSEPISSVVDAIRKVDAGEKLVKSQALAEGKEKLTRAEREILKLLAQGMKYQEIATNRKASPATVRKQCELLLLKLGLDTREQLIAWAVDNGYGTLDRKQ